MNPPAVYVGDWSFRSRRTDQVNTYIHTWLQCQLFGTNVKVTVVLERMPGLIDC